MPVGKRMPGLTLARRFFSECVQPILESEYPSLRYAAALLGPGSEVLGFDDKVSTDHDWGPRCTVFLTSRDLASQGLVLRERLTTLLPTAFLGVHTSWTQLDPPSTALGITPGVAGDVRHNVEITSATEYLEKHLGITRLPVKNREWLAIPEQKLLEFTAGEVFRDDTGEVGAARAHLRYFPEAIRLQKLHALWTRVAEESAFIGRAGEAGDELGSRVEAAQFARWLMQISFLLERRYVPYAKWLGRSFRELRVGPALVPILLGAMKAETWQDREARICEAIGILVCEHAQQKLISPLPATPVQYFTRAQKVVDLGPLLQDLKKQIPAPFED